MTIDDVSLILRLFSIGNLILFTSISLKRTNPFELAVLILIATGSCAYLILTAPIDNSILFRYRSWLLFFTELLPFLGVIYALSFSTDTTLYQAYMKHRSAVLTVGLGVYATVFLLLDGHGWLHTLSHALGALFLVSTVYFCFQMLNDDLDDSRRRYRVLFGTYLIFHLSLLLVFDSLGQGLNDNTYFGAFNALMIFVAILVGINILIRSSAERVDFYRRALQKEVNVTGTAKPQFDSYKNTLEAYMEDGGYRESELTISNLANRIEIPEHKLRKVINETLGYKNFSTFLNSYRIPAACEKLKSPAFADVPILTIALDLGYGSINPFNRAFKQLTNMTPTQYRGKHLRSEQSE